MESNVGKAHELKKTKIEISRENLAIKKSVKRLNNNADSRLSSNKSNINKRLEETKKDIVIDKEKAKKCIKD